MKLAITICCCTLPLATSAQEIASTNLAEICAGDGRGGSAYSRDHRLVYRGPGIPGHIRDHVVPLCLGGADTDRNIMVQTIDEAHVKDRLEVRACRDVCAGRVSLATAQAWFTGDWRIVYKQVFGDSP